MENKKTRKDTIPFMKEKKTEGYQKPIRQPTHQAYERLIDKNDTREDLGLRRALARKNRARNYLRGKRGAKAPSKSPRR